MTLQTRENLMKAMHCEAFAFAKYMLFARQARRNGREELATLFERTAETERLEHFAEEADLACLLGNDVDNLRSAIQSEIYEVDWLYHDFAKQAAAAGDDGAAVLFAAVGRDETDHRDAFKAALQKLEADLEAGNGLAIPAGALSCMTS